MRLITAIKIQADCQADNDLRNIPTERKKWIADIIEKTVPSGLATIDEWNEVLFCFGECASETDSKEAKKKVLSILRA